MRSLTSEFQVLTVLFPLVKAEAPLLHKQARCVKPRQTNLCSSGTGSSRHSETSWPRIQWDDTLQEFASVPLSNEFAFA